MFGRGDSYTHTFQRQELQHSKQNYDSIFRERSRYDYSNRNSNNSECLLEFNPSEPYELVKCVKKNCGNCKNLRKEEEQFIKSQQQVIKNSQKSQKTLDQYSSLIFRKGSNSSLSNESIEHQTELDQQVFQEKLQKIQAKYEEDKNILLRKIEKNEKLLEQDGENEQIKANIKRYHDRLLRIENKIATVDQKASFLLDSGTTRIFKIISKKKSTKENGNQNNDERKKTEKLNEQIINSIEENAIEIMKKDIGEETIIKRNKEDNNQEKSLKLLARKISNQEKKLDENINMIDSPLFQEIKQHIPEEQRNNFMDMMAKANNLFGNSLQKQKSKDKDQGENPNPFKQGQAQNLAQIFQPGLIKQQSVTKVKENKKEGDDKAEQQQQEKQEKQEKQQLQLQQQQQKKEEQKPPQEQQEQEQSQQKGEEQANNNEASSDKIKNQKTYQNLVPQEEVDFQIQEMVENLEMNEQFDYEEEDEEGEQLQVNGCKIQIQNLNSKMEENELRSLLSCFGEMLECQFNHNENGESLDAVVKYREPYSAQEAVYNFHQQIFEGRLVSVKLVA